MNRKSKKDRGPPPIIRNILAMNVASLRDRRYGGFSSETARNKQLAKDAGTTPSQIQRILAADLGTSIDMLDALARALNCRPFELLIPYFSYGMYSTGGITLADAPDNGTNKVRAFIG